MAVEQITSSEQYAEVLAKHEVVIVDFYADWCGDCRMIAPFVEKYSKEDKYKGIHFAKVDVQNEALDEVAKGAQVKKLPTFQIFRGGKKIEGEIFEPKPNDLIAFLEKGL